MKLFDLIDERELSAAYEAGYVSLQKHVVDPLAILNYTHACQWDRAWNATTRQCRGLIFNTATELVVARPFPKFFNHGEHEDDTLDLYAPCEVTDKMDGSLGILYPASDGWAIATRGSFYSEQATHATEILRSHYGEWEPLPGFTYLYEIIFPENRIVVDYGGMDDLVLLGAIDIETGQIAGPSIGYVGESDVLDVKPYMWPGPVAQVLPAASLAEALALPDRANCEGVVVRYLLTDEQVKIKQEDYVALHRLITGLNERTVWERLGAGDAYETIIEPLPEEFHGWVKTVCDKLILEAAMIERDAAQAHVMALEAVSTGPFFDRKAYALWVQEHIPPNLRPYTFLMLDGKDVKTKIWRTIRPAANLTMLNTAEEDE